MRTNKKISKEIIILGIPIILSNMSRVIMSLADMAMVGHLGAGALAATGMGSLIIWIVSSMGIGLRTGVQAVSSRRLGQKKFSQCSDSLWHGVILASIISIPLTIIGSTYSSEISYYFLFNDVNNIMEKQVIDYCAEYIFIGFFSVFFVLTSFVFQGFYISIKETKVHMVVTISSNILNVYLNAALIYGSERITAYFTDLGFPFLAVFWNWAQFPALEVKGAAIATLIAFMWMLCHYFLYLYKDRIKVFSPFKFIYKSKKIIKQIKLGFPIGIQEMLSMTAFAIFYKIIAMIGPIQLATSEIILNIAHASFMPAVGIGMASATLVGKYLGEKKYDKAELVIINAIKWSLLFMGSMGTIFIFFPQWIIPLFTNNIDIITSGIPCLRIIGVLQYFDAIGLTLFFILPAAGNTLFPAIVNTMICWMLFLPLSYYLAIVMGMGVIGAWLAFAAWIIPFALIMALKVRTGSWKLIEI